MDRQEGYWAPPEKLTSVKLIDTAQALQAAVQLLPICDACGIDAEWAPGSSEPQAAVLQLAFRRRDTGHCIALILDMLALCRDDVAAFLTTVFAEDSILKLGFGLSSDLWAVAARLGKGGTKVVSITRPVIDIKTLYATLVSTRHMTKAPPGLSGLVDSLLGSPLDKTLQCSTWEERPLSHGQITYAAADAIVLLHLLQTLVAAVPPHHFPMPESCGHNRDGGEASNMGVGYCSRAESYDWPGADEPSNPQEQEAVASALKHWGETWTLSQSKHVKRVAGRSAMALTSNSKLNIKETKLQAAAANAAQQPPWAAECGSPRFVADAMCEGVARQLRQCGIDAASCPADPCTQRRHTIYRALAESCEMEGRVVLTSDASLAGSGWCCHCFHVTGANKKEQLLEVLEAFKIDTAKLGMLSRCGKCNGAFSKTAKELTGEDLLPRERAAIPLTVLNRHTFWRCSNPNCGQIYWRGSVYERAVNEMTNRLDGLNSRVTGGGSSKNGSSGHRAGRPIRRSFWGPRSLASIGIFLIVAVGNRYGRSAVT